MIADIIKQKNEILEKIEKAGIPKENLYTVLLYGSHLWGYEREDSDIDLYIIVKNIQKKVKDIDNISLHYQITPKQVNNRIKTGSWASYFCIKHASYLIYGKRPEVVNYPKNKILEYIKKNKGKEIDVLHKHSRSWAFQTLMKRLFFVNYYFNDLKTFKLTDFQKCNQLSSNEIQFLDEQYVKIFSHEEDNKRDIYKIKEIILKIEGIIKYLVKGR